MNQKDRAQRPIGYWLKRTDEALTTHINSALSEQGLTRFHWQALNILHQAGVTTQDQILAEMRDFVTVVELEDILAAFEQQGWVMRRPGASTPAELELTDAGRQGHASALRVQTEVRKRAVEGVSQEEYLTVIRVLERIVANLEGGNAAS